MAWHKKEPIRSREDFNSQIKLVLECLFKIPSMSDKLPNYIMNRIESIIEYAKKEGWNWIYSFWEDTDP